MTWFGDVYRGRTVLVTGHTGFKGSWLSIWLGELGAKVVGYALAPPTQPSLFELTRLGRRMKSYLGDVRDLASLKSVFDEKRPSIVFHLAAQPLVRESYRMPKETFDTNVGGTVNVLECARLQSSVEAVVVITSDKCYENQEWGYAYRENDPLGGFDPYSASKGCAEIVAAAYRRSFFRVGDRLIGSASGRGGNVIGGGDWAKDRLIPDCVRALAAGKPVVLRNPDATRPWQHVLEPLSGYLRLGELLLRDPLRAEGAWNFGPLGGEPMSVRQMVAAFLCAWGGGSLEIAQNASSLHEAHELQLSCHKAVSQLGWRPVLSVEHAVEQTASWYAEWHAAPKTDLLALTASQIASYCSRAAAARIAWTTESRRTAGKGVEVEA